MSGTKWVGGGGDPLLPIIQTEKCLKRKANNCFFSKNKGFSNFKKTMGGGGEQNQKWLGGGLQVRAGGRIRGGPQVGQVAT